MGQWRTAFGRRRGDELVEIFPHDFEGRERAAETSFQIAQDARQMRKLVDREQRHVLADGLWPQAQHCARHHAERAFGADEGVFQVVAGIVLDETVQRRHHGSVREHHFKTQDQLAHHAVAQNAVAAGVGRNVAADRRRTPGAEIQRKEQAFGFRRFAHRLQHTTGLDCHGRALGIDVLDAVHALQRQCDGAVGACALDQAGASAPRHDRLSGLMAKAKDGRDLFRRGGTNDRKRSAKTPARHTGLHRIFASDDRAFTKQRFQTRDQIAHAELPKAFPDGNTTPIAGVRCLRDCNKFAAWRCVKSRSRC